MRSQTCCVVVARKAAATTTGKRKNNLAVVAMYAIAGEAARAKDVAAGAKDVVAGAKDVAARTDCSNLSCYVLEADEERTFLDSTKSKNAAAPSSEVILRIGLLPCSAEVLTTLACLSCCRENLELSLEGETQMVDSAPQLCSVEFVAIRAQQRSLWTTTTRETAHQNDPRLCCSASY